MAADANPYSCRVLSDVHVRLSHSENIDTKRERPERQRWISRYFFSLPKDPVITAVELHEDSDKINTCLKTGRSLNTDFKWSYHSSKEQFPALDEDGDAVLERKERDLNKLASIGNVQTSKITHFPQSIYSDTNVCLPDLVSCSIDSFKGENGVFNNEGNIFENSVCNEINSEDLAGQITQTPYTCKETFTLKCKCGLGSSRTYCSGPLTRCCSPIKKTHYVEDCCSSYQQSCDQDQSILSNEVMTDCGVLTIEHSLETSFPEVGFQVWSGAFLLCDYLIHHSSELNNESVLDLGAGTGITSIVAAMFAPQVICTDYLTSIVELSERNWERNKKLIPKRTCDKVCFAVLDWTAELRPQTTASESKYTMTSTYLKQIEEATLILAAEVIYDEELTDELFKTIYNLLMKLPPKTVLLTMERRVVFSAENHEVCSPACEHFIENIQDLITVDEGPICFTADNMDTSFPQYFQYQRVKELELWKISSHKRILQ